MQHTEDQLIELYEKLPEDIQKAIADANTEQKITAIGNRHGLHVDQIGELADETGLMMLGVNHPNQFVTNLIKRLGLAQNEAETIAQEVNTEVLASIRETIKKMAEQGGESNEVGTNNATQSASNISATTTTGTPVGQSKNVFEQKVSKMFSLPNQKADVTPGATLKPWDQDPYLERPE